MATVAERAGIATWPASERRSIPLRLRVTDALRIALVVLVSGHLGRVPLLSGSGKEAPILLNDLVVMSLVAVGALAVVRTRRVRLDGVARLGLIFGLVGGVSALLAVPRFGLSAGELAFSLAYLARWIAYFGIYIVVINTARARDVPVLWSAFETVVVAFALVGIFQAAFLPGFAQIVYPESQIGVDWDYQGHRLVSTFLDPNFAGALIAVALIVQVALLTTGAPVSIPRLVVLACALVLTISRSSILAMLVGMAIVVMVKGISRRVIRLGAAAVILLAPLLPWVFAYAASLNKFTLDASALGRVFSWLRALELFVQHPVLGVGFNTLGFAQRAYGYEVEGASSFGVDGGLLFIAVTTGVAGVAIYIAMMVSLTRRCRAIWRSSVRTPLERGIAVGAVAATGGIVVHSLFVNSIVYPFLMEAMWVLWGLTYAATQQGPGGGPMGAPAAGRPMILAGASDGS